MNVLEPANLPVDQILALTRAIQPTRHFDVTSDRLDELLGAQVRRRREARRRELGAVGVVDNAVAIPCAVAVPCTVAVPCAVAMAVSIHTTVAVCARVRRFLDKSRPGDVLHHTAEPESDFGRGGRFARIAAAEDHVFHAIAAQTLRALLTHHPGDRIGHVALAAAIRADDGRDPLVEGQLRSIGERLETVDL